ncbi:hypothetical protein ASE01_05090 [Nocardioides sp. Root190]|uniref:hypothetical protein n=1 Tax=Nocardioides sp. Root190 TaxID=1736488 RepID=UPI0006FF30E5|nr:hypothetical protein [Nocardioides sp. Root190]KRB78627.1 hypothetical protein ASE01_05090 [Nocardioides sp. Root190]
MSVVRRSARLGWRFVVLEVQLYIALGRWVGRRPAVPEGADAWGYSRLVTPVLWLWIFGSVCELPLAHVLVPWHGVRIALLVIGIWGLVWMLGLLASIKVYPHLVGDQELVLRFGKFARLDVPRDQIASARTDNRDVDGGLRSLQPRTTADGIDVQMPVNDRVNVLVRLTHPLTVSTSKGPVEATSLSIWADEPREMVAALNRWIEVGRTVGGAV